MYTYEEKSKNYFINLTDQLDANKATIIDYDRNIKDISEKISSLEKSMQLVPDNIKGEMESIASKMVQTLENYNKDFIHASVREQSLKDEIFKYQNYLCPHVNTTYDHEVYHKREKYYKCDFCGKVI